MRFSTRDRKKGFFKPPFLTLKMFLNDTVMYFKKKMRIEKVKINIYENSERCYTNGEQISIGMRMPFIVSAPNDKEKLAVIQGIIFHEFGHILYTHFSVMVESFKWLTAGSFWPTNPKNGSCVIDYIKESPENAEKVYIVYRNLLNIVEDARIEYLLLTNLSKYSTLHRGLRLVRQYDEKMALPFQKLCEYSETLPEEKAQFHIMCDLLLQVGRHGHVKGATTEDYKKNKILKRILSVADNIDAVIDSLSAEDLYKNFNYMFAEMFEPYIKPYLDTIKKDKDEKDDMSVEPEEGSDVSSGAEESEGAFSEIEDAMSDTLTRTSAVVITDDVDYEKEFKEAREEAARIAEHVKSSRKSKSEDECEEEDDVSDEVITDSLERTSADDEKVNPYDGLDDVEGKRLSIWDDADIHETIEEKDMNEIMGVEIPDSYALDDNISEELAKPLSEDLGDINMSLEWVIIRPEIDKSETSEYDLLYGAFDKNVLIGKEAARLLKPYLQKETKHVWEKNRYFGSKFNATKLANPDLKYFSKRTPYARTPSLSIAILVDESGSMGGNKIKVAKATAITLYEMCCELDVPFCVMGHTETFENPSMQMTNYCMFDEKDDDAKYRLLFISAKDNNRDGAALRYTAEILSKRVTDRKLLIVISDGQPWACNYAGASAVRDIKSVIEEYEPQGIDIIAAAIDADKEVIKSIYGEPRFLSINNLEDLPNELVRIVTRSLF